MGLAVCWENREKTIIRMVCEGTWSLEDLHTMLDQHEAMITAVLHPVDTIFDMSNSGVMPGGILSVRGRFNRKNTMGEKGLLIVVGANSFAKTMLTMINQMLTQPMKIYFTASVDDAYTMLENVRERRRWLAMA